MNNEPKKNKKRSKSKKGNSLLTYKKNQAPSFNTAHGIEEVYDPIKLLIMRYINE